MTTDLDFVGPPPNPSNEGEPKADAQAVTDAGSNDAPPASTDSASRATSVDSASSIGDAAPVPTDDDAGSSQTTDASLDDARWDASPLDASTDAIASDADASACVDTSTLLTESYEGDLTKWSAVNWQSTECQQTDIASDIAVESAHSVRSRIECASDEDHLHYTSFQLFDESSPTPPEGIEAQHGVLLSFSVWLSVGYDFDSEHWLDFVRFVGTCDRTDPALTLGLHDPSRQLSVSRGTTTEDLASTVAEAPQFPLATWAHIDVYVNYADGDLIVWQDGKLVTAAEFEAATSGPCHLELGTMASRAHSDLVTFQDDVRLAVLAAPLEGTATPPTLCDR